MPRRLGPVEPWEWVCLECGRPEDEWGVCCETCATTKTVTASGYSNNYEHIQRNLREQDDEALHMS